MADRDLVRKDRQSSPASSPRGTNYLLAIAINDYQHCSKLSNAVRECMFEKVSGKATKLRVDKPIN